MATALWLSLSSIPIGQHGPLVRQVLYMSAVHRILDANANRAREALRVMEESARFILNDGVLSHGIKSLRHDLAKVLAAVPGLIANRDTPRDVGTSISTDAEQIRESVCDVAVAAGKRLSEALRAIEEYGKTLPDSVGATGFAERIERLRYRGYDIEQKLIQALGAGRARQWRLCVLLTESLCVHATWQDVLDAALDAGADCIQIREKQMEGGWLRERVMQVKERCAGQAAVIVNDRVDVALAGGADGVHLGQMDLSVQDVRRLAGTQLLVGVSTSNLTQARRAVSDGADYCGVGPMFATTTKKKDTIVGPAYLQQYTEAISLPHLAIGGIDESNVGELIDAGAKGAAVSSAVCSASDPGNVVTKMLEQLPVVH